jgi:hypothetical protein
MLTILGIITDFLLKFNSILFARALDTLTNTSAELYADLAKLND